jgi:hypothetical protein
MNISAATYLQVSTIRALEWTLRLLSPKTCFHLKARRLSRCHGGDCHSHQCDDGDSSRVVHIIIAQSRRGSVKACFEQSADYWRSVYLCAALFPAVFPSPPWMVFNSSAARRWAWDFGDWRRSKIKRKFKPKASPHDPDNIEADHLPNPSHHQRACVCVTGPELNYLALCSAVQR